MANDVVSFRNSINEWIDGVTEGVELIVDGTLTKAANDIVKLSPVDTGRFRGNWQATGNSPAAQSLNNYDPDGNETRNSLRRQIYALARDTNTKVIYITNRLDYAQGLEFGSSNQAPSGVLGVVQKRLGRYFAEAVQEAKRAL
ncbi:gp47 [Escherichia phage phiEB49]|uniref:Gp47 n=1 Tax=Escherichia phage phiEB49 TaxID=1048207 RepID=F8UBV7_9CAUD|nr:tail completion or Neck1 protein [Escherichia phage phiEB49]AEI91247.1 gp47 [Escherichia phage phiEB49]